MGCQYHRKGVQADRMKTDKFVLPETGRDIVGFCLDEYDSHGTSLIICSM